MNEVSATLLLRLASLFTAAACFGGLTYVLIHAASSGAEVYSGTYSEKTARQFEDIFLFIPPRRIAEAAWACAGIAFLLIFTLFADLDRPIRLLFGIVLGMGAASLALMMPARILAFLRVRRRRKFNLQLIDALAQMSNALKAGFSITQSLEAVVQNGENPISQEFELFLQQTRLGMPFHEALRNMDERVGSEDLTLVCISIETARKTGGNLTEIFDKIAHTIRERIRIENRVQTLTAQGRLQGIVIGLMPLLILVAMSVVRPGLLMPFLHSYAGMTALAFVVVLEILGGLMIRKITRIDV